MGIDTLVVATTLHFADLKWVIVRASINLGVVTVFAIIQDVVTEMLIGWYVAIVPAVVTIFVARACGRRRRRRRGRVGINALVMTAPIYLAELHWVIIPATVHPLIVTILALVESVVDEIIGDMGVVTTVITVLAVGARWRRVDALIVPSGTIDKTNLIFVGRRQMCGIVCAGI